MNTIPNSKVILLRHAESIKNVKKIHGGLGEALTDNGVQQARNIASRIETITRPGHLKIYTSTSNHTRYTAEIIAENLKIKVEPPFGFRPLHLGIADGVSEDELMLKNPEVHMLFQQWRSRKIDIKKLKVPEMEDYMDFWARGENIIKHLSNDSDNVLVCSNSLMILLCHYMLGNHPQLSNNYKHFSIDNCGMVVFNTQDYKQFMINKNESTIELDWIV